MTEEIFSTVKPILRVNHLRLKFEEALKTQSVPVVVVGEVVRMDGSDKFIIKNSKGKLYVNFSRKRASCI